MTVEVREGWLFGDLPGPGGERVDIIRFPRVDQKPWSRLIKDPPNLCLHTTEGGTSLGDRYKSWEFPPNFAVGDGKIVQLFPLGYASEAVDTKDGYLLQVEIAYTVGGKPANLIYLPPPSSLDPLVALVAFLHKRGLITTGLRRPNPTWPVALDRGPQAVPSYYRRTDGTWAASGVYGHVEMPDDEHWDPGSFDYPTFFGLVQDVLDGTSEEDEMFKDWRAGWQAHEDGKVLNADWPQDKKDGWRDRDRVLKDAKA
jgi:hypothetical protein